MLANDIADRLKTIGVAGNPPIRVATLAADQAIGVVVKTPIGGMATTPEMPRYSTGAMQVLVRHKEAMTGYQMALDIMEALTVLGEPVELATYRIVTFYPVNEPIMFPSNLAGLFEFSINFMVHAVRL
jgi:hypothetical protein